MSMKKTWECNRCGKLVVSCSDDLEPDAALIPSAELKIGDKVLTHETVCSACAEILTKTFATPAKRKSRSDAGKKRKTNAEKAAKKAAKKGGSK